MQKITPEIKTPVAAGEMQHGSSRWLRENEYHKAFKTIKLDMNSELIRSLIKGGQDDYREIELKMKDLDLDDEST